MKKVSIIIPVYNTEQYLRKCVSSVIGQTYQNLEIICIDDGSTDASGRILDELAIEDKRMVVIHQKNIGESGARNVGLQNATGDYIGFVDCDDWIEPVMYQELVYAIESAGADMAISSWYQENEDESKIIKNKKKVRKNVFGRDKLMCYVYERDAYRAFAYMWDKLYKKELFIDENGEFVFFDETLQLGGDVLVLARLVLNTKKAVYIDKPFYHYVQRSSSGCHSVDLNKRMDWLKAYEIIINLFGQRDIEEKILAFVKRFLAYHSSIVARLAYEQKNEEILKKSQKNMKLYENEYKTLNVAHPDRIKEFEEIMKFSV